MNPTQRHLRPHIHDLDITQMRLGDRLIDLLILRDAAQEVALRFLGRDVLVIGIAGLHFERDVGGDDGWIVAGGLEEDQVEAGFLGHALFDARSGRASVTTRQRVKRD